MMHKVTDKLKNITHRNKGDEYDNTVGATTYGETGVTGAGHHHATGLTGTDTHETGEVISERPVAVGVAEVPVVVTEQERATTHTQRATEEVCGQKTFTEVEDRPIVTERTERILQHQPVEKQYVVETRFAGERPIGGGGAEIVDVKERVVEEAEPGPACPANAGAVMSEVVGGMTGAGVAGTGLAGTHGHHHHTPGTGATDRQL